MVIKKNRESPQPLCGRRNKVCRGCSYRFPATWAPACTACSFQFDVHSKLRKCPSCKAAREKNEEGAQTHCPQCGEDRACENPVQPGKACSLHGGESLSGAEHGRWAGGTSKTFQRHSQLPDRMAIRVAELAKDRRIFDLREDIGMIDVLVDEASARLDTGEAGQLWLAAQKALTMFLLKRGKKGEESAAEFHLRELQTAIEGGLTDAAARREIVMLKGERRKLVTAAVKHKQIQRLNVPLEDFLTLIATVKQALSDEVPDKKLRTRVKKRIKALTGVDPDAIILDESTPTASDLKQ